MADKKLQIEIVVDEKGAIKDVRQLGQELDKAGKQGVDAFSKVDKSAAMAGTALKAATGAAVAAAAAIAGISMAAKGSMDAIAEIEKSARMAGVTAEAYQRLSYAAKQYQISQDALTDGLKELSLRADEFVVTGAGPALEAFKRLGLSQDELKKRMKDVPALFQEIVKRMEGLETAAQIRIADELFGGTGGEQFVALVQGGSKALSQMTKEAGDLGLVMSQNLIKSTIDAKLSIEKLTGAISGNFAQIVAQVSPDIQRAAENMTQWVGANQEMIRQNIVDYLGRAETAVRSMISVYNSLDPDTVGGIGVIGAALFGKKAAMIVGLANLLPALANSVKGFQMAGEGKLDWLEFAGMNAEELSAKLKELAERTNTVTGKIGPMTKGWEIYAGTVEKAGKSSAGLATNTKKAADELAGAGQKLKSLFSEIDDMMAFDRDFLSPSWIDKLNRDIENQIDAGAFWDLGTDNWTDAIKKTEAAAKKAAEDAAKAAEEAAKEAAEKAQAEYDRFLGGVQDATADVFYDLFQNVEDGWENLWQGAKNYVLRVLAEIAAAAATRQIIVPIIAATWLFGSGETAGATMAGGAGAGGGTDYLGLASNAYSVYSGYTGNGMLSGIMNMPAWGPGSIVAGGASSTMSGAIGGLGIGNPGAYGGSTAAFASSGAPSLGTLGMYGALGSLGYSTVGDWIGLPQGPYSGVAAGLGAVAGGAGGAALGTAYGFAGGGPWGALAGAILGGVLGSFIPGKKQPKMKVGGMYELTPDALNPENLFALQKTQDFTDNMARDGREELAAGIETGIQNALDIFRKVYIEMPEELQDQVFADLEKIDLKIYSKSRKTGDLLEGLEDQLAEAGDVMAESIAAAFRKSLNADYIRSEFVEILGRLDENSIFGQSLVILDEWENALDAIGEKFGGLRKITAKEYAQLTAEERGVVYRKDTTGFEGGYNGFSVNDDVRNMSKLYEKYKIDMNPKDFASNAAGELLYLRDFMFDEIFDLSDEIKDRFASMINPMRTQWNEAVMAGQDPTNNTEFLTYVSDAMGALMKAQAAWSAINDEIDNALEPMGAYESAIAGINAQFDAYIATLKDLEFSQASIDEMEGRRAEVLSRYASDMIDQARLIAEPLTEIESASKAVNDQFDAMVSGLEKIGDKSAEIAQIEAYRAQALDAIAAKEAERTAKELAVSMASVAEAQAGILGQDYRLNVMQDRYGWQSIPGMDVLSNAVQAFATMDYDAVVALADRFGVAVSDLTADMTYLNGMISENAKAAEAEAEARRQSAQAIRDQIAAMREQISLTLYQARGGSMADYYMGQFRAIQNSPTITMDSLSSAADNLGSWYSATVSEMQEAARLWQQVGDITTGLIRTIDDTIISIKTGTLSNALPNQKFGAGDAEYRRLRSAATGSDATQSDLQAFAGFAQTYLGLAQENFKSSSTYDRVRDEVLSDLESIRGDLESGGYEGAILAELESLNDSLDLSQVNATFESLAGWIETEISKLEGSELRLNIDFGDIPADVVSVLESWAKVIQENGAASSLTVDFLVNAVAGGTNILWSDFEYVIQRMGGTLETIANLRVQYDAAAGGALAWPSVQSLIDANQFGMSIQTKLKGEFEGDGLTLSDLQDILLNSNVSPELVRKITTELTGTVSADLGDGVAVTSTPTDSVIRSIGQQVDRMYGWYESLNGKLASINSSLSGGTLTYDRYSSLNNKLRDIAANTAATVSALNNLSAHGDGTVTRGPEIAMIGERGPEAVIPLKNGAVPVQLSGAIGGGRPMNITIQIVDAEGRVTREEVYKISDEVATIKFNNPSSADRRMYS